MSRPQAAAPGQPGPAPRRLRAAAEPEPDHAGRSCSGHAQWPGRWGRRGTPGRAGHRGAGAGREVGGRGGRSRGSRRRPRGAEPVGPRAGRAGMSNGIGQGGREGPAPESQVSGGGAGGSPRSPPHEEVGLPLPSQASLGGVSGAGGSLARLALRVASGGLEHFVRCCPLHAALEETLGVKSSRGHGKDELEVCLFPLFLKKTTHTHTKRSDPFHEGVKSFRGHASGHGAPRAVRRTLLQLCQLRSSLSANNDNNLVKKKNS